MAADFLNDPSLPPEINKYLAILSNDPGSMVFAPLAEAYRKAGMLDEAIKTAQEGLKLHPNYLSGMVALGRAYFEKGMLKEAGEELEQVVKIAPDNIIAKNILEEIEKQSGAKSEEPEVRSQKSEETSEEGGSQVGWAAPTGQKPEAEVEEIELVELEDVPEVEEVEAGEEARPAFGEEITEELWTGEAIPEKRAEPKRGITTETIAELYIKQGYLDKAIDIYQTLYDADPYNEEIKGRLEELKKQIPPVPPLLKGGERGVSGQGPGKLEAGTWKLEPKEEPGTRKLETEDENVKRLEAWLKSIQNERRKG